MKCGYSFWGFINSFDIADTPDGGRAYRYHLVKELINQGHDVIGLQQNRDNVLQNDLEGKMTFSSELPEIDFLLLEWRWKMPGRNVVGVEFSPTNSCRLENELEPDYSRQDQLLEYYLNKTTIPILIIDTDLKITEEDEAALGKYKNRVIILEPSMYVESKSVSRLSWFFPFDLSISKNYKIRKPKYLISYVGNNYEKDEMFKFMVKPLSKHFPNKIDVFGNWMKYPDKWNVIKKEFPLVNFHNKSSYLETIDIYNNSLVSLFLPKINYMLKGSCSVRLCESFLYKSLLLIPKSFLGSEDIFDPIFIYNDPWEAKDKIEYFESLDLKEREDLINSQLESHNYRNQFDSAILIKKLIEYVETMRRLQKNEILKFE